MGNTGSSHASHQVAQETVHAPPTTRNVSSPTPSGENITKGPNELEKLSPTEDLSRLVSIVIEEGWLDAKDVGRYEKTHKSAGQDAYLWKCLFRQKQSKYPHCIWCRPKLKDANNVDSDEEEFLKLLHWPISMVSIMLVLLVASQLHPYPSHDISHNLIEMKYVYSGWLNTHVHIFALVFGVIRGPAEKALAALALHMYRKAEWSRFGV